jgi:hypothetical protein
LMNQICALLLERGITMPPGRRKPEQHLAAMFDDDSDPAKPHRSKHPSPTTC